MKPQNISICKNLQICFELFFKTWLAVQSKHQIIEIIFSLLIKQIKQIHGAFRSRNADRK